MKKTKCVTIDTSLLTYAEETATRLNVPLSALVEEALRMYLRTQEGLKAVAERLAAVENMLRQCLQKEAQREPAGQPTEAQRQKPLGGNVWVEILRSRG